MFDLIQKNTHLYYNSLNRIILGPPKKQPPLRASTIVYPEKLTQDFVSIKINVSEPTRTKSNGGREKFEASIKLLTPSALLLPHAAHGRLRLLRPIKTRSSNGGRSSKSASSPGHPSWTPAAAVVDWLLRLIHEAATVKQVSVGVLAIRH
jgi:hypothetical protein